MFDWTIQVFEEGSQDVADADMEVSAMHGKVSVQQVRFGGLITVDALTERRRPTWCSGPRPTKARPLRERLRG